MKKSENPKGFHILNEKERKIAVWCYQRTVKPSFIFKVNCYGAAIAKITCRGIFVRLAVTLSSAKAGGPCPAAQDY